MQTEISTEVGIALGHPPKYQYKLECPKCNKVCRVWRYNKPFKKGDLMYCRECDLYFGIYEPGQKRIQMQRGTRSDPKPTQAATASTW